MSSIPPPGWLPPVPGPEVPLSRMVPAPSAPALDAAQPRIAPRIGAYLLDAGLATMLMAAAVGLLDPAPGSATTLAEIGLFAVMWGLVRVAAPMVTGESPGKRMLGLTTLDAAGAPIGPRVRALRELVIWLLYWIPLFPAVDAAIAERRAGRSTRDRLAGTTVAGTQGPRDLRVVGVIVLGLLAAAAGWFTVASWDSRPERVERSILASCADQGGNLAQCHCLVERLSGDLSAGELQQVRQALRDRQVLAPSDRVVHTVREAWAECVAVGGGASAAAPLGADGRT